MECTVQEKQNDDQTDRHHLRQSCLLIFELIIFTSPFHAIPIRKVHLRGQASLGFIDGTLKVTIPHTELNRNIALVILPIDYESARLRGDGGHLLHRPGSPLDLRWPPVPRRSHPSLVTHSARSRHDQPGSTDSVAP